MGCVVVLSKEDKEDFYKSRFWGGEGGPLHRAKFSSRLVKEERKGLQETLHLDFFFCFFEVVFDHNKFLERRKGPGVGGGRER